MIGNHGIAEDGFTVLFYVVWADGDATWEPFRNIQGTADEALLDYIESESITLQQMYDLLVRPR